MNSTLVLVLQYGVDERGPGFVELPRRNNVLGQWMLARCQKLLREAGRSGRLGPRVLQTCCVEDLGDACRRPDVNVQPMVPLDLVKDFLLPPLQILPDPFGSFQIHPHATRAHVYRGPQNAKLQIEDVGYVFLDDDPLKVTPETQRQGGVLFGVGADVLGRQLVHFSLGIDVPVGCGLPQKAFVLALVQIVPPEICQGVAEPVLVDQGGGDHRIDDAAFDFHTLRT